MTIMCVIFTHYSTERTNWNKIWSRTPFSSRLFVANLCTIKSLFESDNLHFILSKSYCKSLKKNWISLAPCKWTRHPWTHLLIKCLISTPLTEVQSASHWYSDTNVEQSMQKLYFLDYETPLQKNLRGSYWPFGS